MHCHYGHNILDLMDIIDSKYIKEETFQYMDETTNYVLVDGGRRYHLKEQELVDNELLFTEDIENLKFNTDRIKLPSVSGT